MRIPLDRQASAPLYRQIQSFLQTQILSGTLKPGMRLPASRDLSANLGVSRITVANAYAELEADGLVYTRLGSGTYVAPRPSKIGASIGANNAHRDWPAWQQQLLSRTWIPAQYEMQTLSANLTHPDPISFSGGFGARDLYPIEEFRKTLNVVLRDGGPTSFDYGEFAGYPLLRTDIANILTNQGIPTVPDEVLITSGSQQALSLVAHLLLRPGDTVAVESPTYIGAIDLFRSMDLRIAGIPMDEDGILIDRLEGVLKSAHPSLIYVIPTFQNPTGRCLSNLRRRELLALADRYDIPILEDDCFGDLRYEGRTSPALKTLDPGGRVIYINTFSKMLMPGLRLGYLVACGPVYERLVALKRVTDLSSCHPMQRALEAYMSVGRYQAHLRRACRMYRTRRDSMLSSLEKFMPADVQWEKPQGGMFLWLQLPLRCSGRDLLTWASEEGVIFAPGSIFFPGERPQPYLRLNFVMNPPELIEEGIRRLGRAVRNYFKSEDVGGAQRIMPKAVGK